MKQIRLLALALSAVLLWGCFCVPFSVDAVYVEAPMADAATGDPPSPEDTEPPAATETPAPPPRL